MTIADVTTEMLDQASREVERTTRDPNFMQQRQAFAENIAHSAELMGWVRALAANYVLSDELKPFRLEMNFLSLAMLSAGIEIGIHLAKAKQVVN